MDVSRSQLNMPIFQEIGGLVEIYHSIAETKEVEKPERLK